MSGRNIGISKGTFLWRLLNPLDIWSRVSGLSTAFKVAGTSFSYFSGPYTAQERTDLDPAPQQHSRTTFTSAIKHLVCMLLKHRFKFQPPSLISPITLSVLPQQEKKPHKNKNPFEHFITGWGFSITKASHWFSIQLYFKKASIIWSLGFGRQSRSLASAEKEDNTQSALLLCHFFIFLNINLVKKFTTCWKLLSIWLLHYSAAMIQPLPFCPPTQT